MTIQVITEIVTLQHFSPSDQWTIKDEGESSLRLRKKTYDDDSEDDYTATNTSISKDSDDESVLSTSSSTIASTYRVSFADELVTMEWTRPYTEVEDIPLLYYSTEETNRYVHYPLPLTSTPCFVLSARFCVGFCCTLGNCRPCKSQYNFYTLLLGVI